MSDYQECTLVTKTDTDLVIRAKLVHPDAALPSPLDRPTLLRMILEGAFSRRQPALAELDLFNDGLMNDEAPGLIEKVALEELSGLLGPDLVATYRITVASKARPALAGFKVNTSWNAAAMVPRISREPNEMSFKEFMKAKATLKVDARNPQDSVKERVERLRRLLVAPPHPRDTPQELRWRASHLINMLGEYGADASPAAEAICDFIQSEPAAILALGKIGNPIAIEPILVAFGALVPNLLSQLDPNAPHPLFHFTQYALTALGWFGPQARPFSEAMLGAYKPLPRQRIPLAFARWRVLGDESQRAELLKLGLEEPTDEYSEEYVTQLSEVIFGGPVSQLQAVMDAVRDDVAKLFTGEKELWGEQAALKRLASAAAPKTQPAASKKAAPARKAAPAKRRAPAKKAAAAKKAPLKKKARA